MTTERYGAASTDTVECDDSDELLAQLARFEAEITDADNRRDRAEEEARALLKLNKSAVSPEQILKLLGSCDVPASLLLLVSNRIVETGRRAELVRAREAAVAFEAKYTVRHGHRPSVQAVSNQILGSNTQRRKVGEWRRLKSYDKEIRTMVDALARDADQRQTTARELKIAACAERRSELMGVVDTALKRS